MHDFADQNWDLRDPVTGRCADWQRAGIAVLMDIREELRRLNLLLHCPNFTRIPQTLREIQKNTKKRKRRRMKR